MLLVEQIQKFSLPDLADVGAHVYLWTTNALFRSAFEIFDALAVHYHLTMPLVKTSGTAPCNGYVFAAEYCLLGFAGKPVQKFTSVGKLNWLTTTPIPFRHSCKPDAFYDLVETMSPGPHVDLFARRRRKNWTSWGNQLPGIGLQATCGYLKGRASCPK